MTSSRFIHQTRERSFRHWCAAEDRRKPSTEFLHRVALRPARFRLAVAGVHPGWNDELVLGNTKSAASRRAFYVGRVTEIDGDASTMLLDLWEVPSGRIMIVHLEVDERIDGAPPGVGDQIYLWTWVELPGGGIVTHRYCGRLMKRSLTEEDRAQLQALVDAAEDSELGGES